MKVFNDVYVYLMLNMIKRQYVMTILGLSKCADIKNNIY